MAAGAAALGGGPLLQRWLHHLIGPNEGGQVMGVARGEVAVFLRQLFGFQPDAGQRRRHHDLVPMGHFPPERQRSGDKGGGQV